jgi:hypothetical protein
MIWKNIPGYEHRYEVSDKGLVRNYHTKRILKPRVCKSDGLLYINLSTHSTHKTFILHKLVAEAFVPNPEDKRFVKHKDDDQMNVSADNLYWSHAKQKLKREVATNV